ncbi:YciI family protein [Larkinella sp. VNQ87]|uniref:YciI family protein n=1 Tax=Larkinella sp. VNQ87 TaxID=3400921 RepID=UPI003BFE4BD2
MRYVVHAYDYTDEQAMDRRMAVRPAHFDGARRLKANGNFVLGGALLDPDGKMIGSLMVVDFDSEEQLNDWLQADPYVTGKVWERIDVKPFRQAEI